MPSDLGTIKLTLQKFYRINGGSTQLKGVTPNIVIPDQFEYLKYREKDNPDALPWDEIQKADYSSSKTYYDLQLLRQPAWEGLTPANHLMQSSRPAVGYLPLTIRNIP